jgi:hypothetical protein
MIRIIALLFLIQPFLYSAAPFGILRLVPKRQNFYQFILILQVKAAL